MEIKYKTQKLKRVCTDLKFAKKIYNLTMSKKIYQRINEIKSCDSVDMLVQYKIGRCHLLSADRKNQYAMDLVHPYRLVFEKVGNEVQLVKIIEIVDYH